MTKISKHKFLILIGLLICFAPVWGQGDATLDATLDSTLTPQMQKADIKRAVPNVLKLFNEKSEKDISDLLDASAKGTFAEGMFQRYPKIKTFTILMLKDPLAISYLFDVVSDQNRLLIFAAVNVLILIISFFWKRGISKSDFSFTRRVSKQMTRMFVVLTSQIGFLLFYWQQELYPSWVIFKKVFL